MRENKTGAVRSGVRSIRSIFTRSNATARAFTVAASLTLMAGVRLTVSKRSKLDFHSFTQRGVTKMKSLDFGRFALSMGAAAALLGGCGGSQAPIGAAGGPILQGEP